MVFFLGWEFSTQVFSLPLSKLVLPAIIPNLHDRTVYDLPASTSLSGQEMPWQLYPVGQRQALPLSSLSGKEKKAELLLRGSESQPVNPTAASDGHQDLATSPLWLASCRVQGFMWWWWGNTGQGGDLCECTFPSSPDLS